MTTSTRHWFFRLAVVAALWPASAEAQSTARSFEELTAVVKAEETVFVTDTSGHTVKGALVGVDQASLSLLTGGRTRTFARSDVSAVQRVDGLANGLLIGAGVGLGTAAGILAIAGSQDGYVLPSAKLGAPLLLSGIGALVGALVDRAHKGGRVLYAPLLGQNRQGVLVNVRF